MPVRCSLAHATLLAEKKVKNEIVEKREEDGLPLYQKELALMEDVVKRLQNTSTGSMYMADLGREFRSCVTGLGKRLQTVLLAYPHLVKLKGVRVELVKSEERDASSSEGTTDPGMQGRMEDDLYHPYGRLPDYQRDIPFSEPGDIHPFHRAMATQFAEMHQMYAMYAAQMYRKE